MPWQGIIGHDDVVEQFRRILERGRLASTFLFVGPSGIGKRMFARALAQSLLCQSQPAQRLEPCGHCAACVQVLAGTHPDLLEIAKPPDKSELPIELFIGTRERRMQEGLCHDISLKPFMGGRRVAVIDDADYLNADSANALLKTLEEPPPQSVLILLGTSLERQLPTIRSRAQIVRFRPLPDEAVAELLLSRGLASDKLQAQTLAVHCQGSLDRAEELSNPAIDAFRRKLLERLSGNPTELVAFAGEVLAFVDEAGKEATARRGRLRQIIAVAAEFFRRLSRAQCGAPPDSDEEQELAVRRAMGRWTSEPRVAADCAERCLEALTHVDRNANQATLVECWLDDLGQLAAGKSAGIVGRLAVQR